MDISFFDLHCDTPLKFYQNDPNTAVDIAAVESFPCYKGCFAAFVRDDDENGYNTALSIISSFEKKCTLPRILTEKDMRAKHGAILTLEGGAATMGSPEILEEFYSLGVRALTLTWNGENMLASGCMEKGGLKSAGKNIIEKANRLNMALDLAHLNLEGAYDAVEKAKFPFVSHTACFDVFQHKRNVPLPLIKSVAEREGIIGICFYPLFLGGGDVFEAIYRHIYFCLENGLCDCLSLGSDFDGADMSPNLDSVLKVEQLYEYLLQRGIDTQTLDKIFYRNAECFFKRVLKNTAQE